MTTKMCPACGRDMDAGEPHTADCERGIEQDHQDGDHSGCDHPVARGQEDEDGGNPAIAIIKAHIPSITQDMDDGVLEPWTDLYPRDELGDYVGDKRVCHCGLVLDGYYEYVDHLKEMLK